MKRIILDTSTGCLDYVKHPYDIRIIRLAVYFGDKKYIDAVDMKVDEFFQRLKDEPDAIPQTSQPSPGELLELFEGLIDEGYDEAIVTTISSHLSGTYNGLITVSKILEDRMKIHVYDTRTVCFPEGYYALEAARLTEEGKTVEEIFAYFEELRKKTTIYFAVDNLKYLVKNGRLSGASGFVANVFQIKPLLQVQPSGIIEAVEKIRTTRKALTRVAEKFTNEVKDRKYKAFLVYTGNAELKEFLKEEIKRLAGIEGLMEIPCTPIVGCHVGGDAIGIGVCYED